MASGLVAAYSGTTAREDEPVTVGLPPGDGRGPLRSDEATRKVRVPVGGNEVDRAPVVVKEDPGGDALASIHQGHVESAVVHGTKKVLGRRSIDGAISTASFR
jgi:hypothetical protein